ncbi:hypothetical protein C3L33_01142, partial [Rhododendron williamsianum]
MKFRYAMVCSSNQNRSMEAHFVLKREGFDVSSYGTGAHVKLPGPSLREPNVYDFGTPYKHMFEDLRRKDPELYKRNGILPMLKRNLAVKLAPQRWQENAADGIFDVVFTFEEKVFDMVVEGWFVPAMVSFNTIAAIGLMALKAAMLLVTMMEMGCQWACNDGLCAGDLMGWLWVKLNGKMGALMSSFKFFNIMFITIMEYCVDLHNRDHVLMKPVLIINLEVKDNHEEAAIGARLTLVLCQEIEATEFWEDSIDEIVANFEKQHRRKLLYSISFY